MASQAPLTVMFWPESAYGPTNQRIGGEWSHVDVYLTKTTAYRLLVFQYTVRYPGDSEDDVALLTRRWSPSSSRLGHGNAPSLDP